MTAELTAAAWQAIGAMGVLCLAVLGLVWKMIVAELRHELRPNGGATFRDAIERRFDRLEQANVRFHVEMNMKHSENVHSLVEARVLLESLSTRVAILEAGEGSK